jgi:hypothetical protein
MDISSIRPTSSGFSLSAMPRNGDARMTLKKCVQAVGTVAGFAGVVLVGTLISAPSVQADRDDDESFGDAARIEQGLRIAPVQLKYSRRNRKLVGLGSYFVNAVAECDGCHSAGPPTQYAPGGNPYFSQPKQVNPATYLGGGNDFGMISAPPSPHIVSRNLTPDKGGLPEGGATFEEFFETIRFGIDHDHLHPNCDQSITTDCFPHGPGLPPFNGDLLQVMPWPSYQDWTDHELRAIYEYLKAIPCIQSEAEALAGVHACS